MGGWTDRDLEILILVDWKARRVGAMTTMKLGISWFYRIGLVVHACISLTCTDGEQLL